MRGEAVRIKVRGEEVFKESNDSANRNRTH